MKTPILVTAVLAFATIGLAVQPVASTFVTQSLTPDHPEYKPGPVSQLVQNPAWFSTPSGSGGVGEDQPVWVGINEADTPYTVSVTASGGMIAGLDIYEFQPRGSGGGGSQDGVTHACPQGLVEMLYPGESESTFGYLVRLVRLTTEEHQTVAPASASLSNTVNVVLQPDRDYIVSIDARAGTALVANSQITYSISVDESDQFQFGYPTPGDRPPWAQLRTWSDNSDICIERGPPGAPPLPLVTGGGLGVDDAPELPGGVDVAELLGAGL